jgi:hypothetical protein
MQEIIFFPPDSLRVTSHGIKIILEDFDYRLLPEASAFKHNCRRKSMRIEVSDLTYRSLLDHCEFYEKSFTTAIMQVLVFSNIYHDQVLPIVRGKATSLADPAD